VEIGVDALDQPANVGVFILLNGVGSLDIAGGGNSVGDGFMIGRPDCWCYKYHCRGDYNGVKTGPFQVQLLDLQGLAAAYNKMDAAMPAGGICADFNHTKTGPFRVQLLDLQDLAANYNKMAVTLCPADNYNEMY
jgi:hypothetical protein